MDRIVTHLNQLCENSKEKHNAGLLEINLVLKFLLMCNTKLRSK